jgi:hypothetical protein
MFQILNSQIFFLFFRKTPESEKFLLEEKQKEKGETEFVRVRCPVCKWRPDRYSFWICADWAYPEYFFNGCGMPWNTFETRGLCPGCNYQWKYTSCLECGEWSRHEDWYEEEKTQR